MIKQKFLKVLLWIKDHFHFLVEVVVRLSLGIENKENPHVTHSDKKGDYNDK